MTASDRGSTDTGHNGRTVNAGILGAGPIAHTMAATLTMMATDRRYHTLVALTP